MVDVWLTVVDDTVSQSQAASSAAVVAAESSRPTVVAVCRVGKGRARVGYRVTSRDQPDGRETAQRLIALLDERGASVALFAPAVVKPYIASREEQQRAARAAAAEAIPVFDPSEPDYYTSAGGHGGLDEDQQREVDALNDGLLRDAPWFDQEPGVVSEHFRAQWWVEHLAHEGDE